MKIKEVLKIKKQNLDRLTIFNVGFKERMGKKDKEV